MRVIMQDRLERFEKRINRISHAFNWVAGIGMVAVLAVTVADAFGTKVLRSPVPGGIEMVGFFGVLATAFAIAYTKILGGHIQVEFFTSKLSPHAQSVLTAMVSFFGLVLFVLLSWRSFDYAHVLQASGEVSMTQRIPFYPFVYALAVAAIPVCLVIAVEFLKSVLKAMRKWTP